MAGKNARGRNGANSQDETLFVPAWQVKGRMAPKTYFVYILTNESKMLYTGVTNYLERRVYEHKRKLIPGFTQRYNLFRLVYHEQFGDIRMAIAREKEIKGWTRAKKLSLIRSVNPKWKDLAADWFSNEVP
jgi:putative endonuclease